MPHGLLFPTSSKDSFIFIIPKTGLYIPSTLLHQSWSTGWNKKELSGFTMKDRSDDPLHHEQMLLPWSYILLLFSKRQQVVLNYRMVINIEDLKQVRLLAF